MLKFTLFPAEPQHHYFDVELTISQPHVDGQVLRLPAWIPGSYMIRDFAKHIVQFEVKSDGKSLAYERTDKSTWKIAPTSKPLTVNYRVYAFDASIRAAYLDMHYGFVNGTSVFLEVDGQAHEPHEVEIKAPNHPALQEWHLATTLQSKELIERNFGLYEAQNYDELIDHPLLMGELTEIAFNASDLPHRLILVGKHYASKQQLARDLKQICEAQHRLWGEVPDFERYDFLTIVTQNGFGGLEHRSSTALMCPRDSLEFGEDSVARPQYLEFLSLCSHEYFHNWNIKRLKPRAFIPYQLEKESYTDELWWYEGVTSYYDDLILFKSGVISLESFLKRFNETLTRGLRGKGNLRQSLVESSTLAWTTFYQQNENAPNAISNYYAKGAVLAFYLDLSLQQAGSSLDALLKLLWTQYGITQLGTTFTLIMDAITALAGAKVANDFESLLTTAVNPDFSSRLEAFGLALNNTTTHPISLLPSSETRSEKVALGAALKDGALGMEVVRVLEDSAAAAAGLSARDILIAVDGLQASSAQLLRIMANFEPGEICTIHYLRDQRLHTENLVWQAPTQDNYQLTVLDIDKLPW